MPRIKNAFDKIATLAAEEQTLALAGEAVGASADTTYSSMLKNARNAAEEAITGSLRSGKIKINSEIVRDPASNKFEHILKGKNWIKHRFEKIGKNPDEVVDKIVNATQSAYQKGKLPIEGRFTLHEVIEGHKVEIRGFVENGEVKFGTFFVDMDCC